MKIRYSDNASTTLNAPVEPGHTVIVVASASRFPILSNGDWMYVTVEEEVIRVTNTSGNVFTCEAFDQAHGTGASVENRITADVMNDAQDADIYDTVSDRPDNGTMRHGEIFANSTDKQVGIGDSSGNPVDLVSVRFHSPIAWYLVGDLITYDSGIWKCLLTHTGVWNEANWEPVSRSVDSIVGTANEWTKTQNFNATTLTDATTVAWDTESNQVTSVTLTANRIMGAPTNLVDGAFYALTVVQGAGGQTLVWNTVFKWPEATAPTLSTGAAARDEFVFRSDGTNLYEVGRSLNIG